MRITVDKHISDLLYNNECVVVPGFGAFLTRYYSAEINTATNMLRPPSKRVAFNQRIKENDGLLANQIAKNEGIAYKKALQIIVTAASSWHNTLSSGKKINLKGVGRLFFDNQGLLQFSPALDINYNIHAYGLNIFRATAMEREQQIKSSVNRAIENKTKANEAKTKDQKPKRNNGWIAWAAILGPVAALILYGYFNPEKVESAAGYVTNVFSSTTNNSENDASADDTSDSENANNSNAEGGDASSQEITDAEKSEYGVNESPKTAGSDGNAASTTSGNNDAGISAGDRQNSNNARSGGYPGTTRGGNGGNTNNSAGMSNGDRQNNTHNNSGNSNGTINSGNSNNNNGSSGSNAANNQSIPNFQIVVGSFGSKNNAQNYVSALAGRGYDAYIAGTNGNYTRVAVGRLDDKTSALNMLSEIRQDVNYQAWLNEN